MCSLIVTLIGTSEEGKHRNISSALNSRFFRIHQQWLFPVAFIKDFLMDMVRPIGLAKKGGYGHNIFSRDA